ncbi:hypothetical protein PMIN07_005451 [Paraphaeosphaeria minitans]
MPRSTTTWAFALLVSSMAGPMVATADALPAGPQQTNMRPRYYFPRHVKRQFANTTAPATPPEPTPEPSDNQSPDISDIFESLLHLRPSSSESAETVVVSPSPITSPGDSASDPALTTPEVGSTQPVPSDPVLPTSSSASSAAAAVSSEAPPFVSSVASSGGIPVPVLTPSLSPSPSPIEPSTPSAGSTDPVPESPVLPTTAPKPIEPSSSPGGTPTPSATEIVAPTGAIPSSVVPVSTPAAPVESDPVKSSVASTGVLPSSIVKPTSLATPVANESIQPSVASSGGVPSSEPLPTTSAGSAPVQSSVGSTDGVPPSIVTPTTPVESVASTGSLPASPVQPSAAISSQEPSSATPTTILGPFIIPGSTSATPSSEAQPTQSPQSPTVLSSLGGIVGSTGILPTGILPTDILPTGALPTGTLTSLTGDSPLPTGASPSNNFLSSILSSLTGELASPTGVLPITSQSSVDDTALATGTGSAIPSSVVLPSSDVSFSSEIPLSSPTSGIVVGITTAFGTGATSATATPTITSSGAIPTSETPSEIDILPGVSSLLSSVLGDVSSVVSSVVSDVTSILNPTEPTSIVALPTTVSGVSDSTFGPTAPTATITSAPASEPTLLPSETLSLPDLSSIISSIVSDVSSVLSLTTDTSVLPTVLPTGTGILTSLPTVLPTDSSILTSLPTVLPTGTGILTSLPTASTDTIISIPTSEVPPNISTDVPTSIPTSVPTASGITGPGTGVKSSASEPTATEVTTSSAPIQTGGTTSSSVGTGATGVTSSPLPTSEPTIPVSEEPTTSVTESSTTSQAPKTTPFTISAETSAPAVTQPPARTTQPPQSLVPISNDSATTLAVPSSIVFAPSTLSTASQSAMPSGIAPWIQPPQGMPSEVPHNMFMGQIAFDYGLNYDFVASSGSSNQIFTYLRPAIAQAIGVKEEDVINYGLRAADTTQYKGWVTTLAVFMIPMDKNITLEVQLGQPASRFYHNVDENGQPRATVNELTSLVDPTWPLAYGSFPAGTNNPLTSQNNASPGATDDNGHGGALPGDTTGSRKINPTSAGIATGAVFAAAAYGAAMFFVARRYRNKKAAHRRSSSVPNTSLYTYGSVGGGNWMSGARNGRLTPTVPGSRGSRGSDSSNGRSVRTQQISAPVMAENSLGWN